MNTPTVAPTLSIDLRLNTANHTNNSNHHLHATTSLFTSPLSAKYSIFPTTTIRPIHGFKPDQHRPPTYLNTNHQLPTMANITPANNTQIKYK
jgi:hypothetical protein